MKTQKPALLSFSLSSLMAINALASPSVGNFSMYNLRIENGEEAQDQTYKFEIADENTTEDTLLVRRTFRDASTNEVLYVFDTWIATDETNGPGDFEPLVVNCGQTSRRKGFPETLLIGNSSLDTCRDAIQYEDYYGFVWLADVPGGIAKADIFFTNGSRNIHVMTDYHWENPYRDPSRAPGLSKFFESALQPLLGRWTCANDFNVLMRYEVCSREADLSHERTDRNLQMA